MVSIIVHNLYPLSTNKNNLDIEQGVIEIYVYELLGDKYTKNEFGAEIGMLQFLFKTNTKGGKIYCLNYKNVCKIKDEVYDYIKNHVRI